MPSDRDDIPHEQRSNKNEIASNVGPASALFSTTTSSDEHSDLVSFADGFRDKVRAIHERFDVDRDGYLNYDELSRLQLETGGDVLDENMYVMVCRTLNCRPGTGVSLEGLKLTYAAEGSDVDDDYEKVFGKKASVSEGKKKGDIDDDDVIEVGEGGVDISP
eukprot:CAMPEP_0172487552 /NCGR_PEP_ID=MMETSP1066-20121228/16704_1 /TAXON_ID=671091 /ORGANISM="Coscinodiscus wailesii, Strain CCMP2513" /LENGTH=161 /DNA_ID=CAMNT_0013254249 /DNA_START=108 /DNA_END=593 /DNA_ORIENTATION=+